MTIHVCLCTYRMSNFLPYTGAAAPVVLGDTLRLEYLALSYGDGCDTVFGRGCSRSLCLRVAVKIQCLWSQVITRPIFVSSSQFAGWFLPLPKHFPHGGVTPATISAITRNARTG